jgi:ABC-type dipeptide/oligopeptide/nickel transport system permease subunit
MSGLADSPNAMPTRQISDGLLRSANNPPWRQTLSRLRRTPAAIFGGGVLLVLILIAVVGPAITPYSEIDIAGRSLAGPNRNNWMGTDVLGRDMMSRIVHGARISLTIGLFSVAIGVGIGVALGLPAGYYGRKVDTGISIIIDTMLAFPGILLAIAIVSVLGPSLRNAMIAVGIGSGIVSEGAGVR